MNQRRSPQNMLNREIRTYSHNDALVKERRHQIIDVSCKIFIKQGFERTSVQELAEGLGMTKGNLYHYLGSKKDILYLILDFASCEVQEHNNRNRKEFDSLSPNETLQKSMQSYFAYVDKWQDMYNVINHVMVLLDQRDREIIFSSEQGIISYYESIITKGVKEGMFRTNDARLVAHNILITANAWANRRWFLRKRYSLQEYTEKKIESVLQLLDASETKLMRT